MSKENPANHDEALRFLYKKHHIATQKINDLVFKFLGFKNFHEHVRKGKKVRVPKIGTFTFSSYKARYRKKRAIKKKKVRKLSATMIEHMKYKRRKKNFIDNTDFI